MTKNILVSGGAGYIGSHAAYALKQAGFTPIVIDSLVTGNKWATRFGPFEQGDIGNAEFIRKVCEKYNPAAAMHFAAFIEVGESMQNPEKYYTNNREKAKIFFQALNDAGVKKVVFSSTAAVYGEIVSPSPILETQPTNPINHYGRSKLDAETWLRTLDTQSVTLRYFNVAGAAKPDVGIGEAHVPESHLLPRLILPLIDTPPALLQEFKLNATGFNIFGTDYPTLDGTNIRDYIHVMDLADAHILALKYLLADGKTNIFNLGSGSGYSVKEIVTAAKEVLDRPSFSPGVGPRRDGDPAVLIANSTKARETLGWRPSRPLTEIIGDAAAWHRSEQYRKAMQEKFPKLQIAA